MRSSRWTWIATACLLGCCVVGGARAQEEAPLSPAQAAAVDAAINAALAEMDESSHEEIDPLDVPFERLRSLRLHPDGNLLACDQDAKQIKVIDARGKVVATLELPFGPESIDVDADGTIYTGGEGHLAKVSRSGEVLASVEIPTNAPSPETASRRMWNKPLQLSGIAVSGPDVFVAFGSGWSLGSKSRLFRFDRDLKSPEMIVEGLRGCCQRCDIAANGDRLYVAENTAHRVVAFDRKGDERGKWGERSRTEPSGFGSCCNPMNLCFGADGNLYTAESGLGRVKRYTTEGKFLGLVGYVGVERFDQAGHLAASCSNIAIDVTPDGKRVYVMDYKNNVIRVLQKK